MAIAPESLVGKRIEWTGVHHSQSGDFSDISTHVYAMFDFEHSKDRAVLVANGEPFAVADGSMREVASPDQR